MSNLHLYLDESGVRMPDYKPACARRDGMDYFAFGGVLIDEGDIEAVLYAHSGLSRRWSLKGPLHSTRIRGRRNHFSWLALDAAQEAAFLNDLETTILSLPVIGIGALWIARDMWRVTQVNTINLGFCAEQPTQFSLKEPQNFPGCEINA
jgi:hypothetical protein